MEDKDLYNKLTKRIKSGNLYVDDLIDTSGDLSTNSRRARDLAERTLGSEYLKQTGVSVPDIKKSNRSQVESFLNKLKEEQYPELSDTNIELRKNLKYEGVPVDGLALPDKRIQLDYNKNRSIEDLVGSTFHEGAHQYDATKGFYGVDDEIMTPRKKGLIKSLDLPLESLDSYDVNEIIQKGHHMEIPKKRPGSFGFGALKGLLKSGGFKSLLGPAVGLGLALGSEDASAAIPILDQAESAGMSPEDEDIFIAEQEAQKAYQQSPAAKDASYRRLQKIIGNNGK